VIKPTAPQRHILGCKLVGTYHPFCHCQMGNIWHGLCQKFLPFNHHHHNPVPRTAGLIVTTILCLTLLVSLLPPVGYCGATSAPTTGATPPTVNDRLHHCHVGRYHQCYTSQRCQGPSPLPCQDPPLALHHRMTTHDLTTAP